MPSFDEARHIAAAPEEVWKLLYDPARFPEWMEGIATVTDRGADGEGETFTQYPEGYPDFPMPQRMRTDHDAGRVVVSCLVSYLEFRWVLSDLGDGRTGVDVHADIPEEESHRLAHTQAAVRASLEKLAALAERHPLT
jgi:uncharacterized protein YndB with AHSA1/START domain